MKRCSRCETDKPTTEFYPIRTRNTLDHICKPCRRDESMLRWYANTPEQRAALSRDRGLKTRYGMSQAQYDAMLSAQDTRCAICKQHVDELKQDRLWVDHDHATGKVRGLLCVTCNTGVGFIENDTYPLMVAYLETHAV